MGMLMINCPNTGRALSTGLETERCSFERAAVFFSRTFCPICRTSHEWFATQAWVHDPSTTQAETGKRRFG